MNRFRGAWRHYWVAIRAMVALTLALGVVYPLVITGIAQLALNGPADGSLAAVGGKIVGSKLIGQSFADSTGRPLPQWFQSRPSAAGAGYDATASSGSNLAASNLVLQEAIRQRTAAIAASDGVEPSRIPNDAITASGSGLDPRISPAYAVLQVARVAHARGMAEADVRRLVESRIQERDLGYLGEPTVNVLQLNIALAEMDE